MWMGANMGSRNLFQIGSPVYIWLDGCITIGTVYHPHMMREELATQVGTLISSHFTDNRIVSEVGAYTTVHIVMQTPEGGLSRLSAEANFRV